MRFETLNSRKRKYFLYALLLGVALLLPLILTVTKAKYKTTQSIKIVEGTIRNYSPADFNVLAIKVQNDSGEYDSSNTIPESGYTLNETQSYCTIPDGSGNNVKESSIIINYHDGVVGFDNITKKGTKCYLYFAQLCGGACKTILANMTTITTRSSFSSTYTSTTTGTIFTAEDDDGTSYYYTGAPTDNWVKFAGFYWRIIRINGDGTIRMIYQGTAANTTGTGTQTTTSAFNSSYNNNMYVGYMYTSGNAHGTGTASIIKGVLDSWYNSNLTSYSSYIDTNTGFCGDRGSSTTNGGEPDGTGGTGTTTTWYAARYRLVSNKKPSFKCANSSDLYTISSSNKGNKSLNKAIGLITADEIVYAGGLYGTNNTSYYLYTGNFYWTMSPSSAPDAGVFGMGSNGNITIATVDNNNGGARPVINLKSDTAFSSGNGTSGNPYAVS